MLGLPHGRLARLVLVGCLVAGAWLHLPAAARAESPFVYVTTIDTDIVTPVLAQWIEELIKRAERDGAEALVIQLDTPGGLLTATHDIVKDIMTARVPVIVYVGPSGSRAASAGTFITVAAHVAAMAPGTSIGAAHVVGITGDSPDDEQRKRDKQDKETEGEDPRGEALRDLVKALKDAFGDQYGPDAVDGPKEEAPPAEDGTDAAKDAVPAAPEASDTPDTEAETGADGEPAPQPEAAPADRKSREQQDTGTAMGDKIMNDTIAWARTIAETRGRNPEWMEKAIVNSESVTEDEALELDVVDLIGEDVADVLRQAEGREIRLPGKRTVTLHTAGAEMRSLNMTFRYKFLGALAHPQILLLLLSLGGLGLTMELFNPNGITGVIGAVCLILAYFGLQTLPINVAGALLLLLALVLFIAELKVVSYGLLTLGGAVCFTLGALMLIDSPDEVLRVKLSDVLPVTGTLVFLAGFLLVLIIRSRGMGVMAGSEGMVGEEGVVTASVAPRGKIEVRGEIWNAESAAPISPGTRVRVRSIQGLMLTVDPIGPEPGAETARAPEEEPA